MRRSTRLSTLPSVDYNSSEPDLENIDASDHSSSETSDSDNDGDGAYGQRKTPAKRQKRSNAVTHKRLEANFKAFAQLQAAAKAKASRLLELMMGLPFEVLSQILIFAEPAALWALSMTCKRMHKLLWSRQRSLHIWKTARENLTFNIRGDTYSIPPPPKTMCEPYWAAITQGTTCMACPKQSYRGENVVNGIAVCNDCQQEIMLPQKQAKRRLASQSKIVSDRIYRLCYFDRRGNRTFVSLWQIEKLAALYPEIEDYSPDALNLLVSSMQQQHNRLIELHNQVAQWNLVEPEWCRLQTILQHVKRLKYLKALTDEITDMLQFDPNVNSEFSLGAVMEYDEADQIFTPVETRNETDSDLIMSMEDWVLAAFEFVNSDKPPEAQYRYFAKHSERKYGYTFRKLKQAREQWIADEDARALLEPLLAELGQRQTTCIIWPALPTLCALVPCKTLLEKFKTTNDPAVAKDMFTAVEADILQAAEYFLQNTVGINQRNRLETRAYCQRCGLPVSVMECFQHDCLNYEACDAGTWLSHAVRQQIPLNLSEEHFGVLFDPTRLTMLDYSTALIGFIKKFNIGMPDTHSEAVNKKFRCRRCKEIGGWDHCIMDYAFIIKLTSDFNDGCNGLLGQWDDTTCAYSLDDITDIAYDNHLVWEEVTAAEAQDLIKQRREALMLD